MKIIALGDCNTLGVRDCLGHSFPEMIAEALGGQALNLGHTMATTREGVRMLDDRMTPDFDMVLISYGLTDSWQGLKYMPYVLYYPDHPLRKFARKWVKKIKKYARKTGLVKLVGLQHVTHPDLYAHNIRYMIEKSPAGAEIYLLDTLPKLQEDRNLDIKKYNAILDEIAKTDARVTRVHFYDFFHGKRDAYFQDPTHLNAAGCEQVKAFLLAARAARATV